MPTPRRDSRDAHDTASHAQQFREQIDDHTTPHDNTTLKFTGPISVTDEDAGADPYNRTGRFRRVVR